MRLTKKQQNILDRAFKEGFTCWNDLSTEQRNELAEIKDFKMLGAESTHYFACLYHKMKY